MPSKKTADRRAKITARIPVGAMDRLATIAKANKTTVSALAAEAIEAFVENHEQERQLALTPVERELLRMEERIASLLARLTRSSAQTLYFTMLPYMHGAPPAEPLSQKGVDHLWKQSRQFASTWLARAQERQPPETDELAEEDQQ